MSLPEDVTTCTVTFGKALSPFGTVARITGKVTMDRRIIHAATGWSVNPADEDVAANEAGDALSFEVPHVDQEGFLDPATQESITHWFYTLSGKVVFAAGGKTLSFKKNFQPLVGQTNIDLDLLPDGEPTPGVTAPTAAVLSVAGWTGSVTAANLAEALGLGDAAGRDVGTTTGTVAAGDDSRITGAAQQSANLGDLDDVAVARDNLGLGDTATKDTGTATGTVAAGDDSRITGAAQKASNLSDLGSAATARTNLGLGNAATKNTGTTAGSVAAGDDTRITGAAQKASNLSDLADAAIARTNLGLGTAAVENVGVAGGVAGLDGTGVVPDAQLPARLSESGLLASTARRQALPAPTMQRVTRTEVAFGEPRFIEQFGGYLWGVDGSTGDIYRSTDGETWTAYCNSWPGAGAEGFISRIIPTDDGEVIAMSAHELRKSTNWAGGNAATWTATKITPNGTCTLNALDGDGTKFIVNQYNSTPADWDQSRYAHISLDGGDTWTMRYDSETLHGVSASNESHLHGACYDRWADVFYIGEGHGAAGGVYYSTDDGLTWGGPLNVSDTDTNAPTVIEATDDGLVMGSDNGDNGLFGMLRKDDPATQQIVRTWAFQSGREGLVTFAQRAFRDEATGMVYMSFRSEFNDVPVVLAAGTASSGGLVYELPDLPVVGGADRFSAIGKIDANTLLVYGEVDGDPCHFIGTVTKPGAGSKVIELDNLEGGRTGGFASALSAGRATAEAVQATAVGQTAAADYAGATALGYNANVTGTSGLAAGQNTTAASGAVATGASATAGAEGVAVGIGADAGANGTALGPNATASGSATAIGLNAVTDNATSTSLGTSSSTTGAAATAVGHQASATASSTALGKSATATGGAVSIGQNSSATVGDVALGFGSNAAHAGGVALGGNTATQRANSVCVGGRDVEVTDATKGVILKSPDGTLYRVTVANGGALTVTAV